MARRWTRTLLLISNGCSRVISSRPLAHSISSTTQRGIRMATHIHTTAAHLAAIPEDCARLKLTKNQIQPWEDGMRTDGGKGTYEWWYFDAHLSDGAKLVIVFFTKPFTDVDKPLSPM